MQQQAAAAGAPTDPQGDKTQTDYTLSEVAQTAAISLNAIAKNLKPAALKIAVFFAATAQPPNYTVSPTWVEIQDNTRLVPSAIGRGLKELCDPKTNYVTMRTGGTGNPNRYQVNFLKTIRSTSFKEVLEKKCKAQTALLFEKSGTSFEEVLPTENTALTADRGGVEISTASQSLIERVYSAEAKEFDPNLLSQFRARLRTYMLKLGRDERNRSYLDTGQAPRNPTDHEIAHFLAVADPRRLETLLDSLMLDRKTCYSYGWFPIVAIAHIHRLHFKEQKPLRANLYDVKRKQKPAPAPTQASLLDDIARIANSKSLR